MTDYIFDVDGTLVNVDARVAYAKHGKRDFDKVMNWDLFLDPEVMSTLDTPNWDVIAIFKALALPQNRLIITTARNERHEEVTRAQLERATIDKHNYSLYMREDGDMRPDEIVKAELLEKIKKDGFKPEVAFDDRDQVVKMWRELGIKCYQVREGKF